MVEKRCQHCGKLMQVIPCRVSIAKYCSRKCTHEARIGHAYKPITRVSKVCPQCGKEFEVKKSHAAKRYYCCQKCMTEAYKTRWLGDNNPHWQGGRVEKKCKNCGKPITARRADPDGKNFCSTACTAAWRVLNEPFRYGSRSKSGNRADLGGLYVRSSWEANYARYLNLRMTNGEIKSWEYEPIAFELPELKRGRFYIPDFKITNNDGSVEYHEVKGRMDPRSALKMQHMEKCYPEVKIKLIDKDQYIAIAKQVKHLIPEWELHAKGRAW